MRAFLVAGSVLFVLLAAPVSRARRHNYIYVPPLVANELSQAIQNERANQFHLTRLANLAMVREFHAEGLLVSVPSRMPYYYLDHVSPDYSYLRPWAKLFLDQLSREYYERFGQPLRVTSLLRTVQVQERLTRWNSNAAQAVGADRSSHLTGATLDISKHFMNYRGELWLRRNLVQMERAGYLYAIEEFHQPCFHVMVFPTYREDVVPSGSTTVARAHAKHRLATRRSRAAMSTTPAATHVEIPAGDTLPASKPSTQPNTRPGGASRTDASPASN
ncbi:MAG TPA: DUF5715 family protein [Candidatus Acidoferrum sp.]|nr:DUF5715 family protein [Candidatus Acidoferrum sp.]